MMTAIVCGVTGVIVGALLGAASVFRFMDARHAYALHAIRGLKRGDCWCEKSIANPAHTHHTDACHIARNLVGKL